MSNQKVLLFGSFTEDEIRSFQRKPADKSVSPLEKIGLQFGSLDFNALTSVKGFRPEVKPNASAKAKNLPVSISSTKSIEYKDGEAVLDQTVKESEEPCLTAGGGVPISDVVITDASIPKDMHYLHASDDKNCRDLPCITVHDDGLEMYKDQNGLSSPAATVNSVERILKKPSDHKPPLRLLLPRGLINLGNLCFLNATLQALLSCSPFVQLLLDLRNRNVPKVGYPTLLAFSEFITEFFLPNDSNPKNEREEVEGGKPFSPMMFETVLRKFTPDLSSGMCTRPRQEDAQEFLSFLMDQMHDELLKLDGHLSCSNGGRLPLVSASEDDGWETIGPKNKSTITRTQSFMPSELSAIFGGQLRSVVKAKGNKASATVQPFLLLHLDILSEAVHTIEDALRLFSAPETLECYRASSGKAGLVSASKSVKMQTLSKILILHLMRFSYGSSGSTKLHKPIHFPLELVLGRELLVTPSAEGRKYELVATITHHGREHSMGHYTADSRYSNGQWLRYDDSSVTAVGTNKVLHDQAYVLFYKQV